MRPSGPGGRCGRQSGERDAIMKIRESAENYLEAEYGLTPARLMRLRRMYLE